MYDPDSLKDPAPDVPPSYYWALLAWALMICAVIGLTAYAMGTV